MTRPLLLLWLDRAELYRRALEAAGIADRFEIVSVPGDADPGSDLLGRTAALLAWRVPPGRLTAMPALRWIQAQTAGVEQWLAREDLGPGITLTSARGTHRIAMPENILAALFHITKPLTRAVMQQRESRWAPLVSEPLAGKTLGILGLGAIGAELARKAEALELQVIGTRRVPGPVAHVRKVYPTEGTDEVLGRSDFVLTLLPATPATENFMNAGRFAAMLPSAWFLNFGRGSLVVDADLITAVTKGTIAGAILDVFRTEPLPADHPFWTTPGITVLPHLGGHHPNRDAIVARLFSENARRFVEGHPLEAVVDRTRGY
jgi:glyoxylate/hydroxypyruvate reductase